MIKGIEKLTKEQKDCMERVNNLHTQAVGNDYKAGMKVTETWVDKDNLVCVRLKNGQF